jgi:CcmD family protein
MTKMSYLKRMMCTGMMLLMVGALQAQSTVDSTSAGGGGLMDTMRSHNKIYVVMAVCLTILTVLILYLIRIDLKVSKKEKSA